MPEQHLAQAVADLCCKTCVEPADCGVPIGVPIGAKCNEPMKKDLGAEASKSLIYLLIFGRGGGIRTRDPLHPMQVRYQAALRPD